MSLKWDSNVPPKIVLFTLLKALQKKKDENQAVVNQAVTSQILKLTLFF